MFKTMDPAQRIISEFDRLLAVPLERRELLPFSDRVVHCVVLARCETDMNGFESVFEQALDRKGIETLVAGLDRIGEPDLAREFGRALERLSADGFYQHLNWDRISPEVRREIQELGDRVGDRLWGLDAKLSALLDQQT